MRIFLFFLLCWSSLNASEVKNYQAGKDFASTHQATSPNDTKDIPGFKGTNIPEANFSHGNIQGKI